MNFWWCRCFWTKKWWRPSNFPKKHNEKTHTPTSMTSYQPLGKPDAIFPESSHRAEFQFWIRFRSPLSWFLDFLMFHGTPSGRFLGGSCDGYYDMGSAVAQVIRDFWWGSRINIWQGMPAISRVGSAKGSAKGSVGGSLVESAPSTVVDKLSSWVAAQHLWLQSALQAVLSSCPGLRRPIQQCVLPSSTRVEVWASWHHRLQDFMGWA